MLPLPHRFKNPEAWEVYKVHVREGRAYQPIGRNYLVFVRQTLAAYRAQPATLFVAAATLTAGGILVIVVLHMLAN